MTIQTFLPTSASTAAQPPLSTGTSALSKTLSHLLTGMRKPSPSSITFEPSQTITPIEETKEIRLLNSIAALKVAVAQVSMHLDSAWRERLFAQIDMLHDPEDRDDSCKLADKGAFRTFLHRILLHGPLQRLGLGIDDNGHILASWRNGQDMLSFMFLGKDRIRWAVVRHENGETESAGGEVGLDRLPMVPQPYNPEVWYGNADNVSPP
jgi:hypothetical protein